MKNKIKNVLTLVLMISILISIFLTNVSYASFADFDDATADKQAEEDLSQIASALSTYYAQNFAYPSSLQELVPDFIDKLPVDPLAKKPYLYQAEGDSYVISVFDPKLYHCEYFYYEDGFLTKE